MVLVSKVHWTQKLSECRVRIFFRLTRVGRNLWLLTFPLSFSLSSSVNFSFAFQLPAFGEAQKSLNLLCNGTASPLQAFVSTDRTGYSPGERILLKVQLKNLPAAQDYKSTVFLVQAITYKGRCGRNRTERFQHSLCQRSSLPWEVNELVVPDVPPTMKNCGIIQIAYQLKVQTERGRVHGRQRTEP